MKRLLCILNNMNAGGAETFLMKIYRNIDKTKYQMDFCINVFEKCFYEDEILSMGGRIFRIPSKSSNLIQFKKQLFNIIHKERYSSVLKITSNAMGLYDLKIAKKAGACKCCARSSNSSDGGSMISKITHFMGRVLYSRYVDVAFAPSDLAAKYTFGEKAYKNGNIFVLHNAVDLNVFRYDKQARIKIRREFGISDETKVVGHIGRFMEQKNHEFLAEIFNQIQMTDENTILVLVGDGVLKETFEQKAKKLGIFDKIIFMGIRSDIPDILSAMDVFVFPSLYEGMPNTVIEAQATGLPCVIADTITREADITGLVQYLPLNAPVAEWSKTAICAAERPRKNTVGDFYIHGYDIACVAEELVSLVGLNEVSAYEFGKY